MVSNRRKKWVWLALLLGACGVAWLLTRQPAPRPPLVVRSPGPVDTGIWPPAAQTPVFEPIAAASEPAPAVPPAAAPLDPGLRQRSEWLARLRLSTNLRALLNEAQGQPAVGGLVLAQRIGTLCGTAQEAKDLHAMLPAIDVNHPLYGRHQAAVERLEAWCGPAVGPEKDADFAVAHYTKPGQPDPLLNVLNDLVFQRRDREAALADALNRFDPAYARVLLPVSRPENDQPAAVWFNGERYPLQGGDDAGVALSNIPLLVECAFGAVCNSADDAELALKCAQNPMYCAAANRQELVALMIYDDLDRDPQLTHAQKMARATALLARAQSMADEIVRQIQAKNVAAFMPR